MNLSILDGWWVEGYAGDNGFAIGAGEEYTDLTYQDDVESRAIYDLLEQEIVPLFYTRTLGRLAARLAADDEALDHDAVAGLQHGPHGGGVHGEVLLAVGSAVSEAGGGQPEEGERAGELAAAACSAAGIRCASRRWRPTAPIRCRSAANCRCKAKVNLGDFNPDDVEVQLFHGLVDSMGEIPQPRTVTMSHNGTRTGQYVAVHRLDSVPHERPARLQGARAAAARRSGEFV